MTLYQVLFLDIILIISHYYFEVELRLQAILSASASKGLK